MRATSRTARVLFRLSEVPKTAEQITAELGETLTSSVRVALSELFYTGLADRELDGQGARRRVYTYTITALGKHQLDELGGAAGKAA